MLLDIVHPFNLNEIKNKLIMEVGSGSGRILKKSSKIQTKKNFLRIEPSKAIEVAKKNNINNSHKIEFKNIKGENISDEKNLIMFFH